MNPMTAFSKRRKIEEWDETVGEICQEQIKCIRKVLDESPSSQKAFEGFRTELKETLNGELSDNEIVELLGQYVVIKPILNAVFEDFPFAEKNPISKAMDEMLESLDKEGMKKATSLLKSFYEAIRLRMKNVKTDAEKQTLIKELFEKFFKYASPKQQEKLGIVYTPIEIVDFINQSVADVLKREFNTDITDEGVHILDPFAGTGTFLARMIETGIIPQNRLKRKFESELHSNEIMPLAYYVASMNLESIYYERCPVAEPSQYKPNRVMICTDTFADNQKTEVLGTDIRVIVGNPPYSVGQSSANDDNQNEHYESLDNRIATTYVAKTKATLKRSLYDSYIRAYRWATDRIGDRGVIGFVTNAGWIDSNSANGMRKCMAEEFSSIYIWHLKGNQRTVGEQSRKEGGKVFGHGSRAPVSVVILVKNPEHKGECKIHFAAVDDYLTREEKLKKTAETHGIYGLSFQTITPDEHGDWMNQRDDSFSHFMRMDGKKSEEQPIFRNFSCGVKTNRDAWVYGSGRDAIAKSVCRSIVAYTKALKEIYRGKTIDEAKEIVKGDISWSHGLTQRLVKKIEIVRENNSLFRVSCYRPYYIQWLYYDTDALIESHGRWTTIFPTFATKNMVICVSGIGAKKFSCLIVDKIPCFDFVEKSQCFPRYLYEKTTSNVVSSKPSICSLFEYSVEDQVAETTVDGYTRKDAITPEALAHFLAAYPRESITADDIFYYIYGILHSEDYRTRYANNLTKELPRIPRVATFKDFKAFEEAGRKLADLHINFERVPEYTGVQIQEDRRDGFSYYVRHMKYGKILGKRGNDAKDKTKLIYNDFITVEGIPLEAQEYVVNKKSALDWVVERACVKVDMASGIVNDFNDYATEKNDPRYPLSLFLRVITVSLETMKIVKGLPALTIHPLDA